MCDRRGRSIEANSPHGMLDPRPEGAQRRPRGCGLAPRAITTCHRDDDPMPSRRGHGGASPGAQSRHERPLGRLCPVCAVRAGMWGPRPLGDPVSARTDVCVQSEQFERGCGGPRPLGDPASAPTDVWVEPLCQAPVQTEDVSDRRGSRGSPVGRSPSSQCPPTNELTTSARAQHAASRLHVGTVAKRREPFVAPAPSELPSR